MRVPNSEAAFVQHRSRNEGALECESGRFMLTLAAARLGSPAPSEGLRADAATTTNARETIAGQARDLVRHQARYGRVTDVASFELAGHTVRVELSYPPRSRRDAWAWANALVGSVAPR